MIEKVKDLSLPQLQENNIKKNEQVNFSDMVKDALDKVNGKQIKAEEETIKLVTGDEQDLSKVLLTTEEAYLVKKEKITPWQDYSKSKFESLFLCRLLHL